MTKLLIGAGILLSAVMSSRMAEAQEYPVHRGQSSRVGLQTDDIFLNNPGRMFLRWWDPLSGIELLADNWETVRNTPTDPFVEGVPSLVGWLAPGMTQAFGAIEKSPQPSRDPYLFAYVTPAVQGDDGSAEDGSKLRQFVWKFPSAQSGEEYALYVNIPVGPSSDGANLRYPQRYFVYKIDGVDGGPYYDRVDTYASIGGLVRLGNGGYPSDKTYVVQADIPNQKYLSITLLNTVPRNTDGKLTDGNVDAVVYADAAKAIRSQGLLGSYKASPIVGLLKSSGTTPQDSWRVFAGRNEPLNLQVGSEIRDYSMGIFSALKHNGRKSDQAEAGEGGTMRRNLLWSWPARRPIDSTSAEIDRFAAEKSNWVLGSTTPGNIIPQHANVTVTMDNLSRGVTPSGGWLSETVGASYKGYDFLEASASTAGPTAVVEYAPKLQDGSYEVWVWLPGSADYAQGAVYDIASGSQHYTAIANQQENSGWYRLTAPAPGNPSETLTKFSHSSSSPLILTITNEGAEPTDDLRKVFADMVMFVGQANLEFTSTPLFATIPVNVGGNVADRDVVIAPMENGKIYCLDAKGDAVVSGVPAGSSVYWAYPSDLPSGISDPNQTDAIDGKDGVAEMPVGFGISSALIASVQTGPNPSDKENLLYIASKNGKVYCLETVGRGDGQTGTRYGTTSRRWTWPDDFHQSGVMPSAVDLGPITGSVSYGEIGGQPTLFVPTAEGRIYAIDAVGNSLNKTTTIRWQYPQVNQPVLGGITMTPALLGDKLFFGTGAGAPDPANDNRFFALDAATGTKLWEATEVNAGLSFGPFDSSSPAAVTALQLQGSSATPQQDTVFVANTQGSVDPNNPLATVFAFDASTGSIVWQTSELGSSAAGSLSFTYMNTYTAAGVLDYDPKPPAVAPQEGRPVVIVPTVDGRFSALFARQADLNKEGERLAWGYKAAGKSLTSVALGGRIAGGVEGDPNLTPDSTITDEEFTWMYGCDDYGYLYAFGDDPDYADNQQQLSPDLTPPGQREAEPNRPDAANIRIVANQAMVSLVLPGDFENMRAAAKAGTLTYADVQAAVGKGVTRQHYEFGETLFAVVYDLTWPEYFDPTTNYQVQLTVNSPKQAAISRSGSIHKLKVADATNKNDEWKTGAVAFLAHPIVGTGNNAMAPGVGEVRFAITGTSEGPGQGQQAGANFTIPRDHYSPKIGEPQSGLFFANPLGIQMSANVYSKNAEDYWVGHKTGFAQGINPAFDENLINGNPTTGNPSSSKELTLPFGIASSGTGLAHGQSGKSQMIVYDRSLMSLLLGPDRGLQNVRFHTRDLYANVTVANSPNSVYAPIKETLAPSSGLYSGFEDFPGLPGQNYSLDYPDIRKDQVSIVKGLGQSAENPLYGPVTLLPPKYTSADWNSYRTNVTQYNTYLQRVPQPTQFELTLDVPRFQPPIRSAANEPEYKSRQYVYVESNQPNRSFNYANPQEAYRWYTSSADIAVDRRPAVTTPVVDLGSAASGTGFDSEAPSPWLASSPFSISWYAAKHNLRTFSQPFIVENQGNVNLLNLRVAKAWSIDPTKSMFIPADMDRASWMNLLRNTHTDLDPGFVDKGRLLDPLLSYRSVFLQKARPDGSRPTRLRTNPAKRANANLGVTGTAENVFLPSNFFVDNASYRASTDDDPRVVVSVPIGTPVGSYRQRLFVIDDSLGSPAFPVGEVIGVNPSDLEPYSDPGFDLNFKVRETRLTNRATTKAPSMLDASVPNSQQFLWSNMQPSGYRDGHGNLVIAFASDRLDAQNQPAWVARPKTAADVGQPQAFRIYITTLAGKKPDFGNTYPYETPNPLNDLNQFKPDGQAWFKKAAGPIGDPSWFQLAANETIVPESVKFYRPSFSPIGSLNPTVSSPRPDSNNVSLMAFVGEAEARTAQNLSRPIWQLFVMPIATNSDADVQVLQPAALGLSGARIGKPSVVQIGSTAVIFFAANTAGRSQIHWAYYDGTGFQKVTSNSYVGTLGLGEAFDAVGDPSAVLRPGANVVEVAFTAKMRGRTQSEVYFGRLNVDNRGVPLSNSFAKRWLSKTDPLVLDSTSGIYWAQGIHWDRSQNELYNTLNTGIDLISGNQSILVSGTRKYDADTNILVADTKYGGQAAIDLTNGSVRFTGALLPKSLYITVRYTPWLVRTSAGETSSGKGLNYSGVQVAFDDRLVADKALWFNGGAPIGVAQARADRFVLTYGASEIAGTGAFRPVYRSFRYGVQLPYPIYIDQNGTFGANPPNVSGGYSYQIDPTSYRLYLPASADGQLITVTYSAVIPNVGVQQYTLDARVGIVPEAIETTIPIEQATNESPVSMALDAQNDLFSTGRPPLMWIFWTSARTGSPEVYFETIAPAFSAR